MDPLIIGVPKPGRADDAPDTVPDGLAEPLPGPKVDSRASSDIGERVTTPDATLVSYETEGLTTASASAWPPSVDASSARRASSA